MSESDLAENSESAGYDGLTAEKNPIEIEKLDESSPLADAEVLIMEK